MRRHHGDTHCHQNRCACGCHDAVVRCGRNAHTQYDTAQHCHDQCQQNIAASRRQYRCFQHGSQTCHCDTAGNHTSNTTGRRNRDTALCTRCQCVEDFTRIDTIFFIDQTNDQCAADRQYCRFLNCHAVCGNQQNQNDQRKQQEGTFHQLSELRQQFFGDTCQTQFFRFQMYRHEDTCKIQDRRQDRSQNDRGIVYANEFCHQECRSTHDRRHDLAACGGCSFYRTCKFAFVTCFFHHRDSNGTSCYCVTNGRTGNHTTHGTGDNRYFRRATGIVTHYGVCQRNEEIGDTRSFQECTEDDEYRNKFRTNVDRCCEDTFCAIEQCFQQVLETTQQDNLIRLIEEHCINDEDGNHAQDGQANTAAADFKYRKQRNDCCCDVIPFITAHTQFHQFFRIQYEITEGQRRQTHEQDIIPGHMVHFLFPFFRRENQEAQHDDQAYKQAQSCLLYQTGNKQCVKNTI